MLKRDGLFDAIGEGVRLTGLAAALLLGLATAGPAAAAGDPPKGDSTATAEKLIKAAGFAPDDVGYLVVDLADKKVVAEHNPDRAFAPASVAKVATFIPALAVLGGDHRFVTAVNAEGSIADRVLTGSLVLTGGGDPFLTGDDLQAMAKVLAAGGISRVDGSFLYDAGATVSLPRIDALQPEAAGYNCGVSGLSLNFNRVRVHWQTQNGDRTAWTVAYSDNLSLTLDSVRASFADTALDGPYVRSGPATEDSWLLSANLPAKGEDWLPVGDPARLTAEVFRKVVADTGMTLPEPKPGATPEDVRTLVRHESIPLTDISRAVLHSSNNLSAELVGLATSKALTGKTLSLADSGAALVDWWHQRLPDADWTGFTLKNHSGLSSDSRVTPHQIVAMLQEATRLPEDIDFHGMLHTVTWKGVKGSAHVKTGTMAYVRGLAGYIDTDAGHRLAFAIFFNDEEKRAELDRSFDPHVVAIDAVSRHWRNRAIGVERKLTSGWAAKF